MLGSAEDSQRLPTAFVWAVLAFSIAPFVFAVAGVHLVPTDADGGLVHSLLEWSAVCTSLFTAFLGFLYLRIRADYLVLTIALAALVSGLWDALHVVASLGLMPISTEPQQFVLFTWVVSRTLKALLLLVGIAVLLIRGPRRPQLGLGWLAAGGIAVFLVASAFFALAVRESLPMSYFPGAALKRPWDLPPLLLFLVNGIVLFPILVRRQPGILSRALLLSAIPDVFTGALMSFGSTALYDHAFQTAHALKLVACLVPFTAISLHFLSALRSERLVADRLEHVVSELTAVEEDLRTKELHLTQLTDNIREVFWISAGDGSETFYVSPAYEEIFGLSCEGLLARSDAFLEVVHHEDRAKLDALVESEIQENFEAEFRIVREDGEIRWLRTQGFPIRDQNGDVYRLAGLTEDVTEHKNAEEALRKSESRMRALLEAMPDLMFRLDRKGIILDYHARKGTPLYKPPSDFLGRPVTAIHAELGKRIAEAVAAALDSGSMQVLEYRMTVDGHEGDYEARFVRSAEDEVLSVIRDITEHKRLEKEVLDVSNREQQRIGHDLHDGISQQLTGIALLCKVIRQKLESRSVPEAGAARQIEELVEDAIAQTRSLARGLAPVQLEQGGLSAALEELALGVETRYTVECRFRSNEDLPIHSHATATHLYRIAQEAVNNAVRHGNPARISIELGRRNGRMQLSVRDDGSGIASDARGNGMGLHIMRYRARMIDASLDIQTAPERGTVVSCQWSPGDPSVS